MNKEVTDCFIRNMEVTDEPYCQSDNIWLKDSMHQIYTETKANLIKEYKIPHYEGMPMILILEGIIMKFPKLEECIEDLIKDSKNINNIILAANMAIGFNQNIKEF